MTDTWRVPPIGIWTAVFRTEPIGRAQELAQEVEALGYGAMWFPESDARESFVNLALLLSATDRIMGGTAVANIWARDALAMECAGRSLTEAFPDRVLLGLGISHQPLVEGMRGHKYVSPLAKIREYLETMDRATYSSIEPATPVRRLLSALGPKMLELTAKHTSGTIPYLAPPEHTAISRAALPDEAIICPVLAVVFESDKARAYEVARSAHLSYYMNLPNYTNNLKRLGFTDDDFLDGGSDRLVDTLVAWGPAEKIVERFDAHFDAGADHVCLQIITDDPAPPVDAWREMASALDGVGPKASVQP